jgi:hypothetical protein
MSPQSKTIKRKSVKSVQSSSKKKRQSVVQTIRQESDNRITTEFTQFRITDEQIINFKRLIAKPNDCFINAMQIMGMLDILGGNILRISCAGSQGFTKEQIEKIFILHTGHNHDFVLMNYNDFVNTIQLNLQPGYVSLGGYEGHVFIVGRYLNGTIVYIDPQLNTICNLMDPECEKYLKVSNKYYLMFHSTQMMTENQLMKLGFQF